MATVTATRPPEHHDPACLVEIELAGNTTPHIGLTDAFEDGRQPARLNERVSVQQTGDVAEAGLKPTFLVSNDLDVRTVENRTVESASVVDEDHLVRLLLRRPRAREAPIASHLRLRP